MAQATSSNARSRSAGSKRASSKRSNSSGSKAKSSGSQSRNARSSKGATSRNASGTRRKTSASSKSGSSGSSQRGKGKAAQKGTAQRGRSTSQGGQSTVAKVAEKAKTPALAGGAALLGLAGGVALKNRKKSNGFLSGVRSKLNLPKPNLAKRLPTPNGSALSVLGEAATEVAKGSSRVRDVASQVQKAAETISPESSTDDAK